MEPPLSPVITIKVFEGHCRGFRYSAPPTPTELRRVQWGRPAQVLGAEGLGHSTLPILDTDPSPHLWADVQTPRRSCVHWEFRFKQHCHRALLIVCDTQLSTVSPHGQRGHSGVGTMRTPGLTWGPGLGALLGRRGTWESGEETCG